MSINNLSTELYFKIFDHMNMEDLLLLYNNPLNKSYKYILKGYYNFENLKDLKSSKLLSFLYKNDLVDTPIININTILEVLKNKNKIIIKNDIFSIKEYNTKIKYYLYENKIIVEEWYENGQTHRNNEPAIIHYDDNGKITYEAWFKGGRGHRIDGPAEIRYKDGQITYKNWRINGQLHRIDGPAEIRYKNGQITYEAWFKDGIRQIV